MKTQRPIILITGAKGQVGWELQRTLSTLGSIVGIDYGELDLADESITRRFVRNLKPNLIVNAAAYTAVDQAETECELARKLNAEAPRILAEEAYGLKAPFITYSTDYVFDGAASEPYTEVSKPNPLNYYGRTKLMGDEAVQCVGGAYLIFRTSWVYGARGKNFLLTMLRLANERCELRVVDDQIGAPTWCRTIAETTAQVVAAGMASAEIGSLSEYLCARAGIYNLIASGHTSWCGFTKAILQQRGLESKVKVIPILSDEYPSPAPRPKSSLLSTAKLQATFGIHMPDWRESLSQVLESI